MRLRFPKISAVGNPAVRVWRWILGLLPEMPELPDGFGPRTRHRVGFFRTMTAPGWRTLVRWAVVLIGFAIYMSAQLVLAYFVNNLMWWFIVAFFICWVSAAFMVSRPTLTFIGWLVLSPLGFIFLRLDFGPGIPTISFDRIILLGLASWLVTQMMLDRRRPKRPIPAEWMTLLFIGYTIVCLYVAHPGSVKTTLGIITERFDHIVLAVITYYIGKAVLVSRKHMDWVIYAIVITATYCAISGFYEHYTGRQWFNTFMSGEYRLGYDDVEMGRAAGPLVNPTAYGAFLGITTFITLHLFGSTENKRLKAACLISVALQVAACYFSFTRGGYIPMVLMLVCMPFFGSCYRKHYVMIAVVVGLVVMIAGPILMSNKGVNRRITQVNTILYRQAITANTLNIVKHHPFFGIGLGEIDNGLLKYMTNSGTLSGIYARGTSPGRLAPSKKWTTMVTSHNSILTICAEQGLIGAGLLFGGIFLFMLRILKVRSLLPDKGLLSKDLMAIILLGIVGHMLSISGYDIRFFKYPNYFLWVLIMIGVRMGEILQEEKRAAEVADVPVETTALRSLVHV